jgi:hypothetical protein
VIRAVGDAISTAIIAAQLTLAASILIVILVTVPGLAPVPVTDFLHALAGFWTFLCTAIQGLLGPIVG